MQDFSLQPPIGANRKIKRVGRGAASGHGTTSCRGNKGQQSRSGGKVYSGFEGGQMPLYRRLAHRGFCNDPFRNDYQIVNLGDIAGRYSDGETVDAASLLAKGLVKSATLPVKVLGDGEFARKLSFAVDKLSAKARATIEKAGGSVSEPKAAE